VFLLKRFALQVLLGLHGPIWGEIPVEMWTNGVDGGHSNLCCDFFKSAELICLKVHLPARSFRDLSSLTANALGAFLLIVHRQLDEVANSPPQLPISSHLTVSQRLSFTMSLLHEFLLIHCIQVSQDALISDYFLLSPSTSELIRRPTLKMAPGLSSLERGNEGLSCLLLKYSVGKLLSHNIPAIVVIPQ
jgi:hypothetical protein